MVFPIVHGYLDYWTVGRNIQPWPVGIIRVSNNFGDGDRIIECHWYCFYC